MTEFIKQINFKGTTYDFKASYDRNGNPISDTYATKEEVINSTSELNTTIAELRSKLNTIADSDDETLDQLSEVVDYIKNNKSLIDAVTTSKVNVTDIVDNLTSTATDKPLSANQGKLLKAAIDAIVVPTKVSELTNDSGYLTEHQSLDEYAKTADIPTKTSELTNDSGFLVEHQSLADYLKSADAATTYLSKTDAEANYQPKGAYLTEETDPVYSADKDKLALKTEIPTKVSELSNDAGYLTEHQDISGKLDSSVAAETYQPKGEYATSTELMEEVTRAKGVEDTKVDKIDGKGLSTNDYTTEEKTKLAGLENYELPVATEEALGGIKLGFTQANTKYPVQLDANNRAFVDLDYDQIELESKTYGVSWTSGQTDPKCTRIGNLTYHKTLPIQSQMKGVVYKALNTTTASEAIQYYLDEDDWRWKADPTTVSNVELTVTDNAYTITDTTYFNTLQYKKQWIKLGVIACQVTSIDTSTGTATLIPESTLEAGTYVMELGAVLNGYDGEVGVHVPTFYYKSWDEDIKKVRISTIKIDSTWHEQHECIVDAYPGTLLNEVPTDMGYLSTLSTGCTLSVVNDETYCRGGGNRSAYDTYLDTDPARSDLNKGRTAQARATMRTNARKSNKEIVSYTEWKNILYWLFVIEYATFYSQDTFNSELDSNGYHQGGLGAGLTNVSNWSGFNGYYQVCPNGYTNTLGNHTGVKLLTSEALTPDNGVYANRYRGIECPFGDTWKNMDGVIIDSTHSIYVFLNPDNYTDADTTKADYTSVLSSSDGSIKEITLNTTADIFPSDTTASSITTCKTDYYWQSAGSTYTLFLGGGANDGAGAGLGAFHANIGVSLAWSDDGFRFVKHLN